MNHQCVFNASQRNILSGWKSNNRRTQYKKVALRSEMTQLAIMSVSGCSLLPLAVDVVRKEAFLSHTTTAFFRTVGAGDRHAGLCSRTRRNACLNFLNAIRIRKFLINLRHQSLRKASKVLATGKASAWMMHLTLYLNGSSCFSQFITLWPVSFCPQAIVYVSINFNPDSIVFDFLTALIPAIQSCFLNSQIQDCFWWMCSSSSPNG
ncbi:hypothetical protein T4B_14127 [Trichinella pseudospiralis]|uniref:Uncharacterized protein n=1 Tax=Trichinella pseudospiralis TaxID=6337 RepID=A0A0V1GR34_TRIPS|nr:hypothetical protein T4B_14127 [Trichinella pseudospiralis]